MDYFSAFTRFQHLPVARLETPSRSLTGPKILIVDDDEDDQYFLGQAFISSGRASQLARATDGEACLRFLGEANRLPDLILLDLNMPFLNGFEVLRHLQAVPLWSTLAVVVLSTTSDEATRQLTMALGAKACLGKPTDMAGYRKLVDLLYRLYL